jgi:hypothetical protein
MKLTIESTPHTTAIDGVPVRVWNGTSEFGVPCKVFVHRIAVALEEDQAQFDLELLSKLEPGRFIDLRQIL